MYHEPNLINLWEQILDTQLIMYHKPNQIDSQEQILDT